MNKLLRGALLVSALIMTCIANIGASTLSSDYGTCYVTCYDGDQYVQYVQSDTTSDECCAQVSYICPDNNYPESVSWSPYEGWPILCHPVE